MFEWKAALRLQRAETLGGILSRLRSREIGDFLYRIEYSKEWYTRSFHHGDDFERTVDTALSFFSDICYMMNNKLIGRSEIDFFGYELRRVLSDAQTLDYLYNIHHFARHCGIRSPFYLLEDYAKAHNYVCVEDFDNPDAHTMSQTFHKYLNW